MFPFFFMNNWFPIVTEQSSVVSIKDKIEGIYHFLLNKSESLPGYGLLSGTAGEALFLFYYYRYSKNEDSFNKAIEILENAIEQASENSNYASFCNGLAGLGWLIEFLNKNNFIEVDSNEILMEADSKINVFFNNRLLENDYDFLHGGIGCALYFLDRSPFNRAFCDEHVQKIHEISIEQNDTMYWIHRDSIDPRIVNNNLGLAHGIPSILSYLCYAYKNSVVKEECFEMIQKSVNYIKSCVQDPKQYGSFFPYYITKDQRNGISRLAWCYGDLGVGLALLKASEVLRDNSLRFFALDIFDFHSNSIDLEKYSVRDAGLCHGTSGIAQIFQRINQYYPNSNLQRCTEFWINETLKMARFDDGVCGFKMYNAMNGTYENASDFLTGVSGIGLMLISSISNIEPAWDKSLLIS